MKRSILRENKKDNFYENSKISIIVPVYNVEDYIYDTLNDLVNQTYKNFEVIVIDDGSTDRSLSIIRTFCKSHTNIKVITNDNSGPSKCRNMGIELAEGDYIRFVDADDRIPKKSMENLIKPYLREKADIDLVIGNFVNYPEQGHYKGDEVKNGLILMDEFAELFLGHIKSYYMGVPWNKLYRKDIIEKYHIRFSEDVRWCEDFLFNLSYYEKCRNVYLCNVSGGVYHYYSRSNSITHSLSKYEEEELMHINEMRYEKAKAFCEQYYLEQDFELEWEYATLYAELSIIAKQKQKGTLRERYKQFTETLEKERVYQFICMKYSKQKLFVWDCLKQAVDKQTYIFVFIMFYMKGRMAKYIKPFKSFFRGKMQVPSC